MDWKHWFITQKFRLDMVATFLVFVNFGLLIITSSDKVQLLINTILKSTGNPSRLDLPSVMVLMFAAGITAAILFGLWLDKKVKYWQGLLTIQNTRNPQIMEILENTKKIREEVEQWRNAQQNSVEKKQP